MFADQQNLAGINFFATSSIEDPDTTFSRLSLHRGFINIAPFKSVQMLREVVHVIRQDNNYYPSFALAVVAAFCETRPEKFILDGKGYVSINDSIPGSGTDQRLCIRPACRCLCFGCYSLYAADCKVPVAAGRNDCPYVRQIVGYLFAT